MLMSELNNMIIFYTLRRMTVGFYGYIGQNYIFAYFNSKTSKFYKKKNLKKKNLKNSPIFLRHLPWLLGGDIMTILLNLFFVTIR